MSRHEISNLCLYLHFRDDLNTCFYVGMGKPTRPFDFNNRSTYWKRIFLKHGVRVEIVYKNLNFDTAVTMERSYIAHFTSISKLVNMTSGGEGMKGIKNSDETRMRKSASAIKLNADPIFKIKKLEQMKKMRTSENEIRRIESLKKALKDPIIYANRLDQLNKSRPPIDKLVKMGQTLEVKIKRGNSIRKYLTDPETRHIGLMKTALMNAARWKRPYSKLPKWQ